MKHGLRPYLKPPLLRRLCVSASLREALLPDEALAKSGPAFRIP